MAYLSASDFLAGIVGQEEDVEIAGVGMVRIRPLTTVEAGKVFQVQDAGERIAAAVGMALVEPKLTEDETRQLLHAAAGRMAPLVQRVLALAGMMDTEEAASLAGGGS